MKSTEKIIGKIIGIFAIVLIFASITFNSLAQETTERNVGSFESIDVSGAMDVFLTEGTTENVKIEAKGIELDKILTEVKDQTLKISMKNQSGNWSWGKNVEIKVYVTYRKLNAISNRGSSDIIGNSVVKNETMDISLSGSGDIKMALDVKSLSVSVSGSSDIRVEGTATKQEIRISGSGNFDGKNLEGKEVKVQVSGSGDATVWATEMIDAKVSGSGDVSYKGNPSKEISKVSGSGTIRKS
jgi:hypothetical protein